MISPEGRTGYYGELVMQVTMISPEGRTRYYGKLVIQVAMISQWGGSLATRSKTISSTIMEFLLRGRLRLIAN